MLSMCIMTGFDIIKYSYCFSSTPFFKSGEFKDSLNRFLISTSRVYGYESGSLNADSEETDDINDLKKSIDNSEFFKYYIIDKKNNKTYSNIKNVTDINDYIKNKTLFSLKLPTENAKNSTELYVSDDFKNYGFEGYFIVPGDTGAYSSLTERIEHYNTIRKRIIKEIPYFIVSLILGVALLWYLNSNFCPRPFIKPLEKVKSIYRKLPFDIRALIFILYTIIMISFYDATLLFAERFLISRVLIASISVVFVLYLLSLSQKIKTTYKGRESLKLEWDTSLIHKFSVCIKELFIVKETAYLTIAAIVLGITFIVVSDNFILLKLCYIFIIPFFIIRTVGYLNKIIKGTEEITSGNLNYSIEERGKGHLSELAHNINNMRSSFKKSVESEMKSERMKSELITNVSHDLRTPLTSIINYVNLSKQEGLSKEEMDGYIEIIDRKTQRLKVLIDDLFEASKMTSGEVDLNIERIDIVSLLNQTIGELDEKIRAASLTFKINTSSPHLYLNLDGKKTWRVFENLIGNILKYSQPNTRVYIDVFEESTCAKIVMKNISNYELNFDTDEIFERFKRGDKSRTTEGSGLGLAIARSIVELHGGKLSLEIDGDLFKAVVELPKEVKQIGNE